MNLLVDMGNTRIKWTLAASPDRLQMASAAYQAPLPVFLDGHWAKLAPPARLVVASVVGDERTHQLQDWVAAHWAVPVSVLKARREMLGVKNSYDQPAALGSDRWAALIAARHLDPTAACIIDCGTAVTVDALAADGEFLGGVILPGLSLMRESLKAGTAGIRASEGTAVTCLARSTAQAVAAGALFGLAGALERIVVEQQRTLGEGLRVLLTGGDAEVLLPYLRYPVRHMPDLVLRGLAVVADAAE